MQIHEGVEHCQVQLFPGRTGTKSRAERGVVRWAWEWTGGEGVGRLRPLFCTEATPAAGESFGQAPITGLAPGQGYSEGSWEDCLPREHWCGWTSIQWGEMQQTRALLAITSLR